MWGKSLKDYDMDIIISQFPTNLYEIKQSDDFMSFRLKDSISSKEIVSVMSDFFRIFPRQIKDGDLLLGKLEAMTMDELRKFAKLRSEENFQHFSLYGMWYGMKIEIDGHYLYPDTDIEGFLICQSYGKMIVEDDIAPFNFLTDLLRYRLHENPLANTLISFLSQ